MKLQQLNYYVKVSVLGNSLSTIDAIKSAKLETYNIVVVTDLPLASQKMVNDYCREHGVKFISADALGVYG